MNDAIAVAVMISFSLASVFGDERPTALVPVSVRGDGAWMVVESLNFRCRCQLDGDDARRLAETCEIWRSRLRTTWFANHEKERWEPKCDVIVHLDKAAYNQSLRRPGDTSVGSTMMDFDQGRVVLRRIDLRADANDWSNAALPHELTHVVLGERFRGHALPRWADEGIAMLSESTEKHRERLANLKGIITRRHLLRLNDLVRADRLPPPDLRDAFYGQSVALTSWLVQKGTPARFADFLETTQTQGIDEALKQHYQIAGINALQGEWDQRIRSPETLEFVRLKIHDGLVPIIALKSE